jgi:GNAT superfamily N-acetyltransferase
MLIRHAREDDADAMARVIVDTFFTAHETHIPEEALQRRKEEWTHEASANAWRRPLRDIASGMNTEECIFVACDENGEVLGLAMGTPAEGLARTGEVSAVYVRQDQQGRGIGRRLVQATAAWLHARGHTALHITTLAANAPARRFYEVIGGTQVGEMEMDEYGYKLPFVVYGWPDIRALIPSG